MANDFAGKSTVLSILIPEIFLISSAVDFSMIGYSSKYDDFKGQIYKT
jgi:hypothetical protein